MLEVLYAAALRASELCKLNWEDVDLARREVRVLHGKGSRPVQLFGSFPKYPTCGLNFAGFMGSFRTCTFYLHYIGNFHQ